MPSVEIPDKLFFKISEVCRIIGVEAYVLRFWETEFPQLAPQKSKAGHRVYKRNDIEAILRIKELLYDRGYTIEGARKYLSRSRAPKASERDKVLIQVRKGLRDILTLLQRKT